MTRRTEPSTLRQIQEEFAALQRDIRAGATEPWRLAAAAELRRINRAIESKRPLSPAALHGRLEKLIAKLQRYQHSQ